MLVGYARVSSTGQTLDVQLEKLAHCERIYQEKRSGTTDQRPQLRDLFGFVREGDTVIVTKLDRLARSILHLCQIVADLASKGVQLTVLDQAIDTHTPTGRLLLHMLGAIAEFENEIRKERQLDGITHAKAQGVRFGHAHRLTPDQVTTLRLQRASGVLIKDLMREYRLSKASVYRYLTGTTGPGRPELAAAD